MKKDLNIKVRIIKRFGYRDSPIEVDLERVTKTMFVTSDGRFNRVTGLLVAVTTANNDRRIEPKELDRINALV